MRFTESHLRRQAQVMRWFAPARFGLFYHWGLFTGGGCTDSNSGGKLPLKYASPSELEHAVPDPTIVARNMVENAVRCGAKYITLTALHSCEGYCVIYPSKLKGFVHKTRLDYLGEFIRTCTARGIKPLVYLPAGPDHWDSSGGPWLAEGYRDKKSFANLIASMVVELAGLHGDKLAGFWIDGMNEEFRHIPAHMHKTLPDCIVINNNNTSLDIPDVDYSTTEFLSDTPCPDYCRPSALRKIEGNFAITPPGGDFNEDIPTCNGWWHKDQLKPEDGGTPYLENPHFLLRQMISSIGQRGQWNFAIGIGPRVDGSLPPEFAPSFKTIDKFMVWGAEAIYGTTGGEHSCITPGWFAAPWSPGGFCSVTVSLKNPSTHYVLVTQAPACSSAGFHTNGRVPTKIIDLRSGETLPFEMMAGIVMRNVNWNDVAEYGVKVLKVEFS